jgi:hypothetical protein
MASNTMDFTFEVREGLLENAVAHVVLQCTNIYCKM